MTSSRSVAVPTSPRFTRFAPIVLVALAFIAFFPALRAPLLFDDTTSIDHNPTITKVWPITVALTPPRESPTAGRPVANYSLAVNHAINDALGIDQSADPGGPDKTLSYHLVNVALHALSALLLFGIIRLTLRTGRLGNHWEEIADRFAFLAAAIWLVHPIQTEAVNYLTQRTELLVSLCYLGTLYCSIRAWDADTPVHRKWWYAAGILACLAGMGSKEVMVSAPLMVLLYDRAFRVDSWRALAESRYRSRHWFYAGLAATWLLLAALVAASPRNVSAGFDSGMSTADYALTQAWAIPHYLRLILWPAGFTIDYGLHPITTPLVVPGLVIIAGLAAISLMAWTRTARWGWLGFSGAWFFAILAPSSSVIPIATEVAAERRIYLALAAVIVVLIVGIDALLRRLSPSQGIGRAKVGIAVLVLGVLAALTFRRSVFFRHPDALWAEAIATRPTNARAWNNLGSVLADAATPQAAAADSMFREAVRLDSSYVPALINLAASANQRRAFTEAEQLLQRAITLAPDDEPALVQLGTLMFMRGDVSGALPHLERAAALAPDDPDAHQMLNAARRRAQQPKP